MLIPPKSRAIQGSNSVTTPAANPLENLRPDIFLDSILIRSISADSIVSLTNSSQTTLEAKTKQLIEQPQYDLTVLKPGERSASPGLPQLGTPLRVIHFNRINLLPTGAGHLQRCRRSGDPGGVRALSGFQRNPIPQHHHH